MGLAWTCDKKTKDGRHEEMVALITVYLLRVSAHEVVLILPTLRKEKIEEIKLLPTCCGKQAKN